jgi:hypothetical protein
MFEEQLEVGHGISKGCRLVVELDSVSTMLVIWEESRGTLRLQIFDKTSP